VIKPYKFRCLYCGRVIQPDEPRGDEEHYGLLRFFHTKCKEENTTRSGLAPKSGGENG
jgi:hypothetical protein